MLIRLCVALVFCAVVRSTSPDSPAKTFFQAIRNNDASLIKGLLNESTNVNSTGDHDTTPLMYAAAFGTIESMKLLLDAGANTNAKNAFGATALMWSAADQAKVRLLIGKGADVNAMSNQGRTPVIIAASHNGAEPIVRLLAAEGADLKASDNLHNTALIAAAQANDADSIQFLIERGVDINVQNLSGGTALMAAAGNGNLAAVRLLLKAGAQVNVVSRVEGIHVKAGPIALGNYTALLLATTYGSPELIKTLLDAGADVNAKDVRGMTPLMMSVTSEFQRPEVVQLLLTRGADPKATSLAGETAGDWATKFAHPRVMSCFKDLIAKTYAAGNTGLLAATIVSPTELGKAVEKSLGLLQATSSGFFREGGCAGCHNQQLSAVALKECRGRSIKIDPKAAYEQVRVMISDFLPQTELLLQRMDPPAGTMVSSFNLMALSAMKHAPDMMTDAMVFNIAAQQQMDGSWHQGMTLLTNARSPMQDGDVSTTAKDILALREFGFPGRHAEFSQRIIRARRWLAAQVPRLNEERTFQLLGLKWADSDSGQIDRLAEELMAEQRSDGGWSQNAYLPSDAYATGQTLYALNHAAGMKVSDQAYERGIQYLLKTQLVDGSWHVRSRALKFQPYFQSGFPHDHDQWISAAATAWSTAALALGLPFSAAPASK